MKIKGQQWVPMTLEGFFDNTNLEGLIGIEELTDYDENILLKGSKKTKRKLEKTTDESSPKKLKSESKNDPETKKGVQQAKNGSETQNFQPGLFVRNPNLASSEVITGKNGNKSETVAKKMRKRSKKKKKTSNLVATNSCDIIENSEENPQSKNFEPKPKKVKKKTKKSKKCKEILKTGSSEVVEKNLETSNSQNLDDFKAWDIVPLPPSILKAISELNFQKPTLIQEKTLPSAILGRRDILGAAETGSGKTLAFGLPILAGILKIKENEEKVEEAKEVEANGNDSDSENEPDQNEVFSRKTKPLYALILTPTRELAIQVKNHINAVAKYTGIKTAVVVGGLASEKQERLLSKGPEIVVATPGRLWELIKDGNEHLSQLDNIRFLAIDETDRMLEKGHFDELHQLLERINLDDLKRQKRQNFVFSATLTLVHDLPKHLLIKKKLQGKKGTKITKLTPQQKLQKIIEMLGITDAKIFDMSKEKGVADSITECKITCLIDEKDYYVYYFLKKHPGRTLVFCNSIGCVKRLATLLSLLDCQTLPLHSSMHQKQRLKNLDRFRENENGILIATDVAARGLDIPKIEHVIHYQTPRTVESYVHRSGRTARAENKGLTMLLVEPSEINNYKKLCLSLNRTEDLPAFPVELSGLAAVKQRVNLARKLDSLELKMKRKNSEHGWLQKAAKEMDLIIDEMQDFENEEIEESATTKRQISMLRKELSTLLGKPVFPRGFSFKYPTSMPQNMLEKFQEGHQEANEEKISAIEIVKQEIQNAESKNKIRIFKKPRLTVQEKKAERKAFKESEKKKKRKIKKEKLMKKHDIDDDDKSAESQGPKFKKPVKNHNNSANGEKINNFSFELC